MIVMTLAAFLGTAQAAEVERRDDGYWFGPTYTTSEGEFQDVNIWIDIDVENIAYEKDVGMYWTDDDWATVNYADAWYEDPGDGTIERWGIDIIPIAAYPIPSSSGSSPNEDCLTSEDPFACLEPPTSSNPWSLTIQYALFYTVDGVTYWDNNGWQRPHHRDHRALAGSQAAWVPATCPVSQHAVIEPAKPLPTAGVPSMPIASPAPYSPGISWPSSSRSWPSISAAKPAEGFGRGGTELDDDPAVVAERGESLRRLVEVRVGLRGDKAPVALDRRAQGALVDAVHGGDRGEVVPGHRDARVVQLRRGEDLGARVVAGRLEVGGLEEVGGGRSRTDGVPERRRADPRAGSS